MPILNNSQYVDRTSAIEKIPFQPNLISSLGLFGEQTVTTDAVTFDERDNTLVLLSDHLRNTDGKNVMDDREFKQHVMTIPHYPVEGTITRNQLKGIRNFDSDIEQAIESAVAEELLRHGSRHDNHLEYLQAAMLCAGQLATTNYGTIDMFTEFDVTKKTDEIDFATAEHIEPQFRAITNEIKKDYTGGRLRGYILLAGQDFFSEFTTHPDIADGYVVAGQNSPLRNELGEVANGYSTFQYGNIMVVQYDDVFRDAAGNSMQPLADDAAVLLPRAALGSTFFGPVSKLSGIGASGARRFASSYRDPKDRYVEVESEQNSLVVLQEISAVHYLSIAEA